ncbi:MAG: exodeoxyribonuclease VII large subunit [Phototrophicaceae bacterium]
MYSISEITAIVRHTLETVPELQDVWIQGEVSNLKVATSGHWYFTLKDREAQMRCIMWKSSTQHLKVPRDGDEVQVRGRIGVYEARGDYQFYADALRPLGLGDLYTQYERLKAKLQEEGLFDPIHKQPLPVFPRRIGVVTSADAAAFQDIQNVLGRRFPLASLILSPTLVQGQDAPSQIVKALQRLDDSQQADVILLIRGGGSIEDLWAFNDEQVARAIFATHTPLVSGIGHETDFTIADFVADYRAPTPSAAAEIITPNLADLQAAVAEWRRLLGQNTLSRYQDHAERLKNHRRALRYLSPEVNLQNRRLQVDDLSNRLTATHTHRLEHLQQQLENHRNILTATHPKRVLERGFAIVRHSTNGRLITDQKQVQNGEGITIQLQHGILKARIEDETQHDRYLRTLF